MFTLEQIKAAHSKVKSGADFPRYIREMTELGVQGYSYYVADGSTLYEGENNFSLRSPARYEPKQIALVSNEAKFREDLVAHQQGQSDFLTFCDQAAAAGVFSWVIDTQGLTCTYLDRDGKEMLTEQIPSA